MTLLYSSRCDLETATWMLSAYCSRCIIVLLIFFTNILESAIVRPYSVYPIALRKAKIVYNFGLSECNMVYLRRLTLAEFHEPLLCASMR